MKYEDLFLAALSGAAGASSSTDAQIAKADAIATAALAFLSDGTAEQVATGNLIPTTVKTPGGVSVQRRQGGGPV